MLRKLLQHIRQNKLLAVGMVMVLGFVGASIISISRPETTTADACDKVNIVYCGLDGSSVNGYINSFQGAYENGSNNGYSDLKAVYRWAGATNTSVANMNTTNTKIGTLYRNGDLKVDGVVVGHDSWVAARFGAGQPGFVQITDHAWARKTTTSLQNDTYKMIVHFGADGNADFAIMVICGNAVKFTPTPQPKPQLVCLSLDATPVTNTRTVRFIVQASAKNTSISRYLFDFGDGQRDSIATTSSHASSTHTFDDFDTDHTIRVTVYGPDFPNGVTSANCVAHYKTPPRGNLVCTSLTAADTQDALTKSFTATAAATNVKIVSYTFTYTGDGTTTNDTVTSAAATVTKSHVFAKTDTNYTVTVTVKGTGNDGKPVTSPACSLSVTTPKPDECKPGVPVGDARCNECKPGIPMGDERCNPQVLADTGPGSMIGLAVAGGVSAYLGRYLYLRRKLSL